ncbi:hypothetical protein [Desulfonatronum parangueonense]
MKRLSLFDLPLNSAQDLKGPRFWWEIRYKSLFKQAVADFVRMYDVEPIFHFSYPQHQVFLSEPSNPVFIDRVSGQLTDQQGRDIWEVDYGQVKAFRPQDVAPQICALISGTSSRDGWRPMVMGEITVPEDDLENIIHELEKSEDTFSLHWPTFKGRYVVRVFGPPELQESLRYRFCNCSAQSM